MVFLRKCKPCCETLLIFVKFEAYKTADLRRSLDQCFFTVLPKYTKNIWISDLSWNWPSRILFLVVFFFLARRRRRQTVFFDSKANFVTIFDRICDIFPKNHEISLKSTFSEFPKYTIKIILVCCGILKKTLVRGHVFRTLFPGKFPKIHLKRLKMYVFRFFWRFEPNTSEINFFQS